MSVSHVSKNQTIASSSAKSNSKLQARPFMSWVGLGDDYENRDVIIRCEIDFINCICVSFDSVPGIDPSNYEFDENIVNDFNHKLNYFWNNCHFYDCFEESIEQAMEKYNKRIHSGKAHENGWFGSNKSNLQHSNETQLNKNFHLVPIKKVKK